MTTTTQDRSIRKEGPNDCKDIQLQHSIITTERGPAGLILKVNRGYDVDYCGPFKSNLIIERLTEVSQ